MTTRCARNVSPPVSATDNALVMHVMPNFVSLSSALVPVTSSPLQQAPVSTEFVESFDQWCPIITRPACITKTQVLALGMLMRGVVSLVRQWFGDHRKATPAQLRRVASCDVSSIELCISRLVAYFLPHIDTNVKARTLSESQLPISLTSKPQNQATKRAATRNYFRSLARACRPRLERT